MADQAENKLKHIVFEITTDCNLNCRYCYNIWKMPGAAPVNNNSYRKAKKTLTALFQQYPVIEVAMSGGEPFLSERFLELVLFCRMKKKNVIIISNGNAASAEDYRKCIDIGVNLFQFPFHSPSPEVHDYMTGVKGSWRKSLESIEYAMKIGADVACMVVITKANHHLIEETLLFLKKIGIRKIMINRFNIGGRGIEEQENLNITHGQLNETYKHADIVAGDYDLKLSSNVCIPLCVVNPADYPHIKFTSCSNDVFRMPSTMDLNGNLRLCNHSPVIIGNIFKDNYDDIFNSPYVVNWSRTKPEYCKDCNKFSRCFAGCRAAAEQLGYGSESPDPFLLM